MKNLKQKEIIKKFKDKKFGISSQAVRILEKLSDNKTQCDKLIKLCEERKRIIGGGDVLAYCIKGKVPTSLINSDDAGGL